MGLARARCLVSVLCLLTIIASAANSSCSPKIYPETGSLPQAVNFGTTLRDIHWLGFEGDSDKYVFAITEGEDFIQGGELWRSDRYGAADSWKNMTDDLEGLFDKAEPGGYLFRGAYALHYHFGNPEKVLVQGAGNTIWTTDNFGQNWRKLASPGNTIGFWTEYKTHPNQKDWMLALVRRHECWHPSRELDKWCSTDLFLTQDFGISWTNLTENSQGRVASFVDYDWGAAFNWDDDGDDPTHADETIFATVYEDPKHMKGPLPSWDRNVHYIVSRDFFKTNHEKLVSCGNQFDIISNKVYLAVPNNCPYGPEGKKRKLSAEDRVSSSVLLYISEDEGLTFTEACLPHGDLDLGYQMHSSVFGHGAYLMLRHEQESIAAANAPVSSVYSGGNTSLFTVGASRVFRRGRNVDYVGLDGLPGIYISNRLGIQALTDAAFHYGTDATDYEKYVETFVSYNGGAHWNSLDKPRNFTHAQCDICSQQGEGWGCQLHLHGPSSWAAGEGKVPQLHSHWNAPGLVMAVGNVGEYLSFAKDYTCTFLSRDGGESWQDIDPRAMAFEFGDHGGILMMAAHQSEEPTDKVMFSQDEGACWHTIQLGEAIDVIGIKVEPTLASHTFLVYGEACFKDEAHPNCTHTEVGKRPPGKLFSLDLEHILGNEWQVCSDDAYEQWSVPTPERCLLGRNITSTRRKRDAACFNSKGWQRVQGFNESCDCEEIDTECDFGYEWSWYHEECRPIAGFDLDTCPHVKDHSYVISKSGKRLLAGDACFNISRVINDTDGRGHSTLPRHFHLPHWLSISLWMLVVATVVMGVMQYVGKSQGGSSLVETIAGPFVNGYDWVRDKVTGGRSSQQDYFQPLSEQ